MVLPLFFCKIALFECKFDQVQFNCKYLLTTTRKEQNESKQILKQDCTAT